MQFELAITPMMKAESGLVLFEGSDLTLIIVFDDEDGSDWEIVDILADHGQRPSLKGMRGYRKLADLLSIIVAEDIETEIGHQTDGTSNDDVTFDYRGAIGSIGTVGRAR